MRKSMVLGGSARGARHHHVGQQCVGALLRRRPFLSRDARHRRPLCRRRALAADGVGVQDRRRSGRAPARRLGRVFQADHRELRHLVASTWTHLRPPGMPSASGFQNVETTFKYQFLTVPEHEFVMSAALAVEWGNTGAAGVGAESFTTYTPTHLHGQRLRRPARHPVVAAADRRHGAGRLCDPVERRLHQHRSRQRRHHHRQSPALPAVRRLAAIQHALPQVVGGRSPAARTSSIT